MPKVMKVMGVVENVKHKLRLRHRSEKNDLQYWERAICHGWRLKLRRHKWEGPRNRWGGWTPTHSRGSNSWDRCIQMADYYVMCQIAPKWAATFQASSSQHGGTLQMMSILEFHEGWNHCSTLLCCPLGKSRRKGYKLFCLFFILFYSQSK